MSSSIITSSTLVIIFLIPSVLVLFSPPTNATSSSVLINKVCSGIEIRNFDAKVCTQFLESLPRVVSATNMFNLSVELINSGISRSTFTRTYIEKLLKEPYTDLKVQGALKECNSSYVGVVSSFESALTEVENEDFITASHDLSVALFDDIGVCLKAVESKVMNDRIISRGNEIVQIFALTANQALIPQLAPR